MTRKLLLMASTLSLSLVAGAALAKPAAHAEVPKEQLAERSREDAYADGNQDGELTADEVRQYRPRLARQPAGGEAAIRYDFPTQFTFAEMSDGVSIALAVGFPRGWQPDDSDRAWPTMFEMMGYPDSTVPRSPDHFGNRYVTVRASVRGAGASGGPISERHAPVES